jgi:tRNA nucleotidyltransferase (CCA-adding enzyme)
MKGITLIQAREKLLEALKKKILPAKTAEDVMSFPAITIPPDKHVSAAVELMLRYNINAVPVVMDGRIEGVVTRQVAGKAAYHGLGETHIREVMTVDCECVEQDTSIDVIREKVIGHGQRLLPVLKEGRVAGVITRTDLLKLLQEELIETPGGRGARERARGRVIKGLMKERLPGWLFKVLKEIGATADRLDCKAYMVGGFVRDLLLRRDNLDVDIVIEGGDGVEFSREFARTRDLRVRAHTRFKTAVLIFPDGFKIDVATARLEYYERPGSLPTIEQSSLKLDLYRRDFIINTLAAALNRKRFGELVDFFGAQKDIKDRKIRVLHNLSFVEDPTRALRAVRFSEKFGFEIEKHTLNLIKNAVKLDVFQRLSGARLLDELRHILEDEAAGEAVKRLAALGLLKYVHPDISWDKDTASLFDRAHDSIVWHRLLYTGDTPEGWLVLFLAITDQVKDRDLEGLVKRLSLSGKKRVGVVMSRPEGKRALEIIESGLAGQLSVLYDLLSPLPLEVIIYLMAKARREESKKALSVYITRLKSMRTHLKGGDLKKMGLTEGAELGRVLKMVQAGRLDGELASRADEVKFIREYLASKKRPGRGKGVRGGAK